METYTERQPEPAGGAVTTKQINDFESEEKFRKYIYELFDKNGVLNDLRAYLRLHIVQVLNGARTGIPPLCQKHFTQRLDLTFQALNILFVEYLLCLDFSYTLSVFLSQIPLSNMVFDFAKGLVNMNSTDSEQEKLRFSENDVWAILNYLGIKCDSEDASQMLEAYKSKEQTPLLMVILQHVALTQRDSLLEGNKPNSPNFMSPKTRPKSAGECEHAILCKVCQNMIAKQKEKYRKNTFCKQEIFEQVREFCESEIEIGHDERELKFASQALLLQQKQQEMEKIFTERERALERKVQQKKKFLWGLATALRDQHTQMARAMHMVRRETDKLESKETSLKLQMAEAEKLLRNHGEDMRLKISEELVVLESQVEMMKGERERISRERAELEQLKEQRDSLAKELNLQSVERYDNIRHHYELLKNELFILKKNMERMKEGAESIIERDVKDAAASSKTNVVLNNEQECDRNVKEENILRPNQVVNELRKQKNVNFSRPKCSANLLEVHQERSAEQRSSESSLGDSVGVKELLDENQRLRALAKQQRDRIASLSAQQSRLEAQQARLETALRAAASPSPTVNYLLSGSDGAARESAGCRAGAGEEVGAVGARARILVPGDALPFIGLLRDRHNERKRQSAHAQLCRLQRPVATAPVPLSPAPPSAIPQHLQNNATTENAAIVSRPHVPSISTEVSTPAPARDCGSTRPKSPRSLLTEAKLKLKRKPSPPRMSREKSPASVLREAKLRLRKLEIEAEAVNQCYRDFRQRQAASSSPDYGNRQDIWDETPEQEVQMLAAEDKLPDIQSRQPVKESPGVDQRINDLQKCTAEMGDSPNHQPIVTGASMLGSRSTKSLQDLNVQLKTTNPYTTLNTKEYYKELTHQTLQNKNDNYISQFQTKTNQKHSFSKNKNTVVTSVLQESVKTNLETDYVKKSVATNENYLDKPLTELRKLYKCTKPKKHETSRPSSPQKANASRPSSPPKGNPSRPCSPQKANLSRPSSPQKAQSFDDRFDSQNIEVSSVTKTEESNIVISINEALEAKKKQEFEIFKTNLTKIYNLKEPPTIENTLKIAKHNITNESIIEESVKDYETGTKPEIIKTNKNNNIIIEIENVNGSQETKHPKSDHTNLLVVVESTVENETVLESKREVDRDGNTAISLGPIRNVISETQSKRRSQSPDQDKFTRKDDVIDSSFKENRQLEADNLDNQIDVENKEYADDFTEYSKSSEFTISVAKSPVPDDFWD